jgi:hypothetical protein
MVEVPLIIVNDVMRCKNTGIKHGNKFIVYQRKHLSKISIDASYDKYDGIKE